MQRKKIKAYAFALLSMLTVLGVQAQTDTTRPTSIDPKLLEWENPTQIREYIIGDVTVKGVQYLDSALVLSISGLQSGDKFRHPGSELFSKAISNLWKQSLFADVQIYVTKIVDNNVSIEINVQEIPKLGTLKFDGIKKAEIEELQGKIGLVKQAILTKSSRINAIEVITKFFQDKGFRNVSVRLEEKPDANYINSVQLTVKVNRGKKVRIDGIYFYGNETIETGKLKRQLKGTKEQTKITLFPKKYTSPYSDTAKEDKHEYWKDLGFLSLSKTKAAIEPYFRFKLFSSAKFEDKKYEEDKEKLMHYYNSIGYRDAVIVTDTITAEDNRLYVNIKVDEGRKYYFGDFTWRGNTKFSDSLLNSYLAIRKGDTYNLGTLNKRLGIEQSEEGSGISGFYQDDGYLFFDISAVETAVINDTIFHEIRIREGSQATYGKITISGNDRTKDHVVRRELRTIPGELWNRTELIRTIRELGNLQYFNQESLQPNVNPNPGNGTVDVNWPLEEKSSDQLELSAGWGGGIGLTGTVGVTFNNFSIKNIWKKEAWDPLPVGDGQKLSLRVQSNGRAFRSYSFSFTEPWLGGKRRNSLTIGFNNSRYSNGWNYMTQRMDRARSDTSYLVVNGISVSMGKQLRWPDDYFSLVYTLGFNQYKMRNYYNMFNMNNADPTTNTITSTSNNLSMRIALSRSSVFDPIFPRSGSNITASVQFTPPYSAFRSTALAKADPYKNPEYHKWRFNAEWYVPLGKPSGEDKSRQFVLKMAAKYGFMGKYNKDLEFSPFERFQVGDAGLTNNMGLLGYDIIAHRGYPVYQTSDPTVNPDQQMATSYFTIFNKYQLELRYPLVTNPSSTIFGLAFFEAANGWYDYKDYNPFRLRRSVGLGMRFYLPMFGLLGFDYGIGIDRLQPGGGLKNAGRFTFMLGFEPE